MSSRVKNITFPDAISRDLAVIRSANTTLLETNSGYEQALGLWSGSRLIMSLRQSITSPDKLAAAIAFLEVVKGRLYGFLCRDWTDYFAGYTSGFIGASVVPETFGTGDGSTTVFQLIKSYKVGAEVQTRKITRPRYSADLPLQIYKYISGAWVIQASGWTVDYTTGLVTFSTPPASTIPLGWAGLFDVPMRFDTDQPGLNMKVLQVGMSDTLKMVQIKE